MIKTVLIICLIISPVTSNAGVLDWAKTKINRIKEYKTNWKKKREAKQNKESSPTVKTTTPEAAPLVESYDEEPVSSGEDFPGPDTQGLETSNFDFLNEMRAKELQRIKDSENYDFLNEMRAAELKRIKDSENSGDISTLEKIPVPTESPLKTTPFTSKLSGGVVEFDVDDECYKVSPTIRTILHVATKRLKYCLEPKDYKAITGLTANKAIKKDGPFGMAASTHKFPLRIVCTANSQVGDGDVYLSKSDLDYNNGNASSTKVFTGLVEKNSMPSSSKEHLKTILSHNCYGCCHDGKVSLCQKCLNEKDTVETRMRDAEIKRVAMEKAIATKKLAASKLAYQNVADTVLNNVTEGKRCRGACANNIYKSLKAIDGGQEVYKKLLNHNHNYSELEKTTDPYTLSLVEHIIALSSGKIEKMKVLADDLLKAGCNSVTGSENPNEKEVRKAILEIRKKMGENIYYGPREKNNKMPIQDELRYARIKRTGC